MAEDVDFNELFQYQQVAQDTAGSNVQWQPQVIPLPPQSQPIFPQHPVVWTQFPPAIKYVLSDFDIELMAACIANKHPVVDGQLHCFCTLKRLERGISKD